MGCAASFKFQCGDHEKERSRLSELREIAQEFLQELFPAILRCLEDLRTCLDAACSSRDTIQDIVERYLDREEAGRRGVGVHAGTTSESRQPVGGGGNTFWHIIMKNLHVLMDKPKRPTGERKQMIELERAQEQDRAKQELDRAKQELEQVMEKVKQVMEKVKQVMEKVKRVMEKLLQRKSEIDKNLRSIKWWHKFWNAMSIAVFIGALVCLVALVALGTVPPAGIIALTSSGPLMKTFEPCIKFIWDRREGALKEEKQMVEIMLEGRIDVYELESLRLLVKKLMNVCAAFAGHIEFILNSEESFEIGMEALKKKINDKKQIDADIKSLRNRVDECQQNIRRAKADFRSIYSKLSQTCDANNQAGRHIIA